MAVVREGAGTAALSSMASNLLVLAGVVLLALAVRFVIQSAQEEENKH